MTTDAVRPSGSSLRIVNIYALRWSHRGNKPEDLPSVADLRSVLNLGRLNDIYVSNIDQLPRMLLDVDAIDAPSVGFSPAANGQLTLTGARTFLFTLPSYQVVVAIELSFAPADLSHIVEAVDTLMDRCIDGKFTVRGEDFEVYAERLAESTGAKPIARESGILLPERHQLVFAPRVGNDAPSDEIIIEILYRAEPPYRQEFTAWQKPDLLNLINKNGDKTRGIVTPYSSLIYGHEPFVEDSILLSTVHAVGTAARFRQIWHESYRHVRKFRDEKLAKRAGTQTRKDLEELADSLGNLEFDLTFSVEFPLMRIESFHSALYTAMDLKGQAETLSQMFNQISGSLNSEITAIEVRERERADRRHRSYSFALSLASLFALPATFVVAFLGINALEVDGELSMLDNRYAGLYAFSTTMALATAAFVMYPYVRDWVDRRPKKRWWPPALSAVGLVLGASGFWGGLWAVQHYRPGQAIDIRDAAFAVGGFVVAGAGLVLLSKGVIWLIKKWRERKEEVEESEPKAA